MMLLEVLITDMMVICGTNEKEKTRLGRVRLGYEVFLFLFAPEMNIIFGISTSNNIIINHNDFSDLS